MAYIGKKPEDLIQGNAMTMPLLAMALQLLLT